MIRVLIERHIAETLESAYEDRSRKVLQNAVSAPGFVSGETLVDTHDSNHRLTLQLALRSGLAALAPLRGAPGTDGGVDPNDGPGRDYHCVAA